MIYAFTSDDAPDYPIKIGVTKNNPLHRLKACQTGNHNRLKVLYLFNGSRETELFLHRIFSEERIGGEWFKRSDRLLETLEKMWRLSPPTHPNGEPSRQKPTQSKKWARQEKKKKRNRTNVLVDTLVNYQKFGTSPGREFG